MYPTNYPEKRNQWFKFTVMRIRTIDFSFWGNYLGYFKMLNLNTTRGNVGGVSGAGPLHTSQLYHKLSHIFRLIWKSSIGSAFPSPLCEFFFFFDKVSIYVWNKTPKISNFSVVVIKMQLWIRRQSCLLRTRKQQYLYYRLCFFFLSINVKIHVIWDLLNTNPESST